MSRPLILLLIIILAGCSNLSKTEDQKDLGKNIPDQESWDADIILSKGGQKQAVVKTKHLRKYNEQNIILMDSGVKADFYDSLGRKTSRLTSEKAKIMQSTNDLYASKNVVVESDSGVTLFTDSLEWINKTGMVSSDVPVKFITKKGDTLYGTSFRSNARLENWTIEKPEGVTPRDLEKNIKK